MQAFKAQTHTYTYTDVYLYQNPTQWTNSCRVCVAWAYVI